MTEEKFEEFIKKAAQGYNAPPARTPREEIWKAIQTKRASGPRVVYGGGGLATFSGTRFSSRVWLGAAAAAMLLVATGVGIGRWTASPAAPPATTRVAPGEKVATARPGTSVTEPEANTPAPSYADAGRNARPTSTGRSTPSDSRRTTRPSAVQPSQSAQVASVSCAVIRGCPPVAATTAGVGSDAASSPSSAYHLTTVRHLSNAEALLTSFRTRPPADRQGDAQLAAWARDLLSSTRLLLDSPVANDPERRPLLEDLELVLVQIVQLSPGSTQQDRDLIEKTLQQDHVLTRLRTAIPAGQRGS